MSAGKGKVLDEKRRCLSELDRLHDLWTGRGPIRSLQIKSLVGYLVEKGVLKPDD